MSGGRVGRLLGYAGPDDAAVLGFLERSGFRQVTETARDWDLPVSYRSTTVISMK